MFLRENEVGRRVAPHLEAGDTVLDLGAGTGRMSLWLARTAGVRPTLADVVPYSNRQRGFPFLSMEDSFHVPAEDRSFDVVLLLFALHHNRYEAQSKIVAEAIRLMRRRLVVVEDTPFGRVDHAFNVAWDKVLNLRHGVPTPFAFRPVAEWLDVFLEHGMRAVHVESYRPRWPTLMTYHHSVFVLEPEGGLAAPVAE